MRHFEDSGGYLPPESAFRQTGSARRAVKRLLFAAVFLFTLGASAQWEWSPSNRAVAAVLEKLSK